MALYDVANSIWKHQNLLRDIKDGLHYLALFLELVDSGAIALLRPWNELVRKSYLLASEQRIPAYGAAFIALSLRSAGARDPLGSKQREPSLQRKPSRDVQPRVVPLDVSHAVFLSEEFDDLRNLSLLCYGLESSSIGLARDTYSHPRVLQDVLVPLRLRSRNREKEGLVVSQHKPHRSRNIFSALSALDGQLHLFCAFQRRNEFVRNQ